MTKTENPSRKLPPKPAEADAPIHGIEEARKLARSGRFISAIKHLEAANLDISREHAKTIVNSFGCANHEWRPPVKDHRPLRCL